MKGNFLLSFDFYWCLFGVLLLEPYPIDGKTQAFGLMEFSAAFSSQSKQDIFSIIFSVEKSLGCHIHGLCFFMFSNSSQDKLTSHRSSTFRDARVGGDSVSGGSVQRLVRLRQRQSKRSFTLGKDSPKKVKFPFCWMFFIVTTL